MASGGQSDRPWLCRPCNMLFSSWEKLREHKGNMRRAGKSKHIHCKFCSEDFKTERAEILHIQEKHPQEQKLECPACGTGPFVRLGGLMNHIEKHCLRLDSTVVSEMRQQKLEFPTKLQALTDDSVKANYTNYMPSAEGSRYSQGQSSGGGAKLFLRKQDDFPGLEAYPQANSSTRSQTQSDNVASAGWNTGKKLFQDDPPAQQPAAEQLTQATAPSARALYDALDPHDPDHPGFNSARYYSPVAEKFGCPRIGCPKMFKKASDLVGHLRSAAHNVDKFRCPYCQRTFGTLADITQHAESSSVRCNIRMMDQYDAYLDQLTGGIVDVAEGSHEDGTPKYQTTKAAREMFGRGKSSESTQLTESGWDSATEADSVW